MPVYYCTAYRGDRWLGVGISEQFRLWLADAPSEVRNLYHTQSSYFKHKFRREFTQGYTFYWDSDNCGHDGELNSVWTNASLFERRRRSEEEEAKAELERQVDEGTGVQRNIALQEISQRRRRKHRAW